MDIRRKSILEAAVKEYIKNGEPVSSKELVKKYKFGVRDATIRNELSRLTKDGFLAQLHTSGGRVPTDMGYQFFVEQAFDDAMDSKKILDSRCDELAGPLRKGDLRDFIKAFSEETRLLGAGHDIKERRVYKYGLDDLFSQLDLELKEEFQEIVSDFEMLDRRFDNLKNKMFRALDVPQVFIGKNSPITKSKNLSVIIDNYDIGGQKVLIAVIGPKRMDYDKNLRLLKELHKYNE